MFFDTSECERRGRHGIGEFLYCLETIHNLRIGAYRKWSEEDNTSL